MGAQSGWQSGAAVKLKGASFALVVALCSCSTFPVKPHSYVLFEYIYFICTGVCNSYVVWLDGDASTLPVARVQLPFHADTVRAIARRGPWLAGHRLNLPRSAVEQALAQSKLHFVPCGPPNASSDAWTLVTVVRNGECRQGVIGPGLEDDPLNRLTYDAINGQPSSR